MIFDSAALITAKLNFFFFWFGKIVEIYLLALMASIQLFATENEWICERTLLDYCVQSKWKETKKETRE